MARMRDFVRDRFGVHSGSFWNLFRVHLDILQQAGPKLFPYRLETAPGSPKTAPRRTKVSNVGPPSNSRGAPRGVQEKSEAVVKILTSSSLFCSSHSTRLKRPQHAPETFQKRSRIHARCKDCQRQQPAGLRSNFKTIPKLAPK